MSHPRPSALTEQARIYHSRSTGFHIVRRDELESFGAEGLNAYFGLGWEGRGRGVAWSSAAAELKRRDGGGVGGGRAERDQCKDERGSFSNGGVEAGLPDRTIPWMSSPRVEGFALAPDEASSVQDHMSERKTSTSHPGPDAAECQLARIASYWRQLRRGVERSNGVVVAVEPVGRVDRFDEDVCESMPGGWRREAPSQLASFSDGGGYAVASRGATRSNCARSKGNKSQGGLEGTEVSTITARKVDSIRKHVQEPSSGFSDRDAEVARGTTPLNDLRHLPPVRLVHPREAAIPRANRGIARVHDTPCPPGSFCDQNPDRRRKKLPQTGRSDVKQTPKRLGFNIGHLMSSPRFIALTFILLRILLAVYAAILIWHVGVVLVRLLTILAQPVRTVCRTWCWFWGL